MKKAGAQESPRLAMMAQLVRRMSEPASYFKGRHASSDELPGNIIGFARHQPSWLQDDAAFRTQHHRFVFIVALKGSGNICVDSETHRLEPGQAQLIFPFQFHSYFSVESSISWVFFTFEATEILQRLQGSPPRALGETELTLLEESIKSWLQDDSLLQLHLATLLFRLAASTPIGKKKSQADLHFFAQVNRIMIPRLDRPFGLKDLASAMGRSESHLRKNFRDATGMSLGRHLRELKIRRACSLLHTSALSIGEIGQRCSFDSIYTFSRAFRHLMGTSPRAYRKSLHSTGREQALTEAEFPA